MATLAELVKKLAEKSGIDLKKEEYAGFAEEVEKLTIEIPEKTDLLSAYILKSDAKNDPEIKNHYYGLTMSQVDNAIFKVFGDLGLTKEALEDIAKNEPNSFKKFDALRDRYKEYIQKLNDPSVHKGEKAELQKRISDLEGEIKTQAEVLENEKRILNQRNEENMISFFLKDAAREFKIIESIPKQYRDKVISESIAASLQQHEAKPVLKDGKLVLVNAQDPTLTVKDGVTINSIIEKGLANDKLLDLGNGSGDSGSDTNGKKTVEKTTPQIGSTLNNNIALAKASMGATN